MQANVTTCKLKRLWNLLEPSVTFYNLMEPYGTLWNLLEPSGTFWNFKISNWPRTDRPTDRQTDIRTCWAASSQLKIYDLNIVWIQTLTESGVLESAQNRNWKALEVFVLVHWQINNEQRFLLDLNIHSPSARTDHHLLLRVEHHGGPARQGVVHEDGVGVGEGFASICLTMWVYIGHDYLVISGIWHL